ncbi:hypothetical protein [Ruminococcus sp.]|uniref:hypothetical protein n=1 Tax=Ruminococcus sp. TaxID=41978 RepID=UPI0025CD8EF8|nr:hypothetical protein [Ruminococcus sp.]MBR1433233.1 hypothetical protein [Ruminococcus sp.]
MIKITALSRNKRLFIFAFIIAVVIYLFTVPVSAALMPSDQLQTSVEGEIDAINSAYGQCRALLRISPFSSGYSAVEGAVSIVQGTALVLVSLFFVIEFFVKTLQFEWVKWENVLLLMAKLFVGKALIDNTPAIMQTVYDAFMDLQNAVTLNNSNQILTGGMGMFISDLQWQTAVADDPNVFGTYSLIRNIQLSPVFLILKLCMLACQVVIIGRIFELMIYTVIAPLPMSTFISSAANDVGKTFVKSYAAVCLQAFILVVMFTVYGDVMVTVRDAVMSYAGSMGTAADGSMEALLLTGALGMGVLKSGSWAKKICGTA